MGPATLSDGVRAVLASYKQALSRAFGDRLERLVLFGSVARGVTHDESDVDLLVLLSQRQPGDGHRAVDAAVEVMLRQPDFVLSPLVMTPGELDGLRQRERLLAQDIDRDGIAL